MEDLKFITNLAKEEHKFNHKSVNEPSFIVGFIEGFKASTEYHDSNQKIRPEMADKILKVRDALIENDYDEAYHQLCLIADPELNNIQHWVELERIAKLLPQTIKCPDCNGDGIIIETQCCRLVEFECCNQPISVQVQCERCQATGSINNP